MPYLDLGSYRSAGFTVGDGLVCYGGAGASDVICYKESNLVKSIEFRKWIGWDSDYASADARPLIVDEVLYFAIGDHVCAYHIPDTLPTNQRIRCGETNYCFKKDNPQGDWCTITEGAGNIKTAIAGIGQLSD